MKTSQARKINTLEELVARGTGTYHFDSNLYPITVDLSFAKKLIQEHHLFPATNTEASFVPAYFFTYVNKQGTHFVILYYEWDGCDSGFHDDAVYYDCYFQVIQA